MRLLCLPGKAYFSKAMKFTCTCILVLWCLSTKAQLHDKTWVCGIQDACKVVFNIVSIDTIRMLNLPASYGYGCISNAQGEFQFFTNGINVYSYHGSQMVNGSNLADNNVNAYFASEGLPSFQGIVVLPKKDSQYYVIYQSVSDPLWTSQQWAYTNMLYYSVVDMSLQNGNGEVTEKRKTINTGQFMDGHITACQHTNGRDWWLVQRRWNSNGYHIYLITPD